MLPPQFIFFFILPFSRTDSMGLDVEPCHDDVRFENNNSKSKLFKKYWANPGLFFLIFVFSMQLTLHKICLRLLDLNRGPLFSTPKALPTEPQPLPYFLCIFDFQRVSVVCPVVDAISTVSKSCGFKLHLVEMCSKLNLNVMGYNLLTFDVDSDYCNYILLNNNCFYFNGYE